MKEHEVHDFDTVEFREAINLYDSSFPPNENTTRPIGMVVEMLKRDENYHLYASLNHNKVVGILLMYVFRSLRIGLLDYIAVHREYQGRRIGKRLFEFTLEKLKSEVTNPTGILIEVQKVNAVSPHERNLRERRLKFYITMGAKIMDRVNYIFPPIQSGFSSEEMYLMIRPLAELHSLPKESVVRYIHAIYSTIYQYHGKDFNSTYEKLPARIILLNFTS